jgi:hypothetical protein
MKRLNPETGLPFKKGYIRQDGFVFERYGSKLKRDGYFREQWYSPEGLKNKKACSRKCSKRYSATVRQNPSGRAKQLLRHAKERGLVSIDLMWIQQKIETGVCEVSGLPFDLSPSVKFSKNPFSPSLDRIDSKNPEYSKQNTRLVLTSVNHALNEFGLNHLLKIAKAIINKQL